jgi:hypothetical protein
VTDSGRGRKPQFTASAAHNVRQGLCFVFQGLTDIMIEAKDLERLRAIGLAPHILPACPRCMPTTA